MKLVLTGAKCSGKSKLGKALAEILSLPFYETDSMIEESFSSEYASALPCRAICSQYGEDFFRNLEKKVIESTETLDKCVISTGGSTLLNKDSRQILRKNSLLILIHVSVEVLLQRFSLKEIPAYLNNKTAKELFAARACLVNEVMTPYSDIIINSDILSFDETLNLLVKETSSSLSFLQNRLKKQTLLESKSDIEIIKSCLLV